MMRILSWLVVTLVIAGVTGIYWLCFTQGGTEFIVRQIDDRAPSVRIGRAEGTLAYGIDIDRIDLISEGAPMTLSGVRLVLDPLALAWLSIHVYTLDVDTAELRLTGSGDGDGGLPAIDIPVRINLSRGSIRELRIIAADTHRIHDIELSGRMSGSDLVIRHLSAVSEGTKLTASLDAELTPPWSLAGASLVDTSRFLDREITLNGTLSGNTDRLDIRASIRSGEEITVEGSLLDLPNDLSVDLVARSPALDLEPFLKREARLADTELHLTGKPRHYKFEGSSTVTVPEVPTFELAITGNGDIENWLAEAEIRQGANRLLLEGDERSRVNFRISAPEPGTIYPGAAGNIEASGVVSFESDLSVESDVSVRRIPLSLIHADIDGQTDLDGRLSYRDGHFDVDIVNVTGELFQQALAGGVHASGSTLDDIEVDARLDIGTNRFVLSGHRGTGTLAVQIHAPELATLHPEADGSLELDASVRLGPDETHIESVRIDARSALLNFGAYRLENLDVRIPGTKDKDRFVATAQWSDLHYGDNALGPATLKYEGSVQAGELGVFWHHPRAETDLTLTLDRTASSLQGRLVRGSVKLSEEITWVTDDNVPWSLDWTDLLTADMSPHCWHHDAARACVDVFGFHDGSANIVARLISMPLQVSNVAVDQDLAISAQGIMDMNLDARLQQGLWSGTFSGHLGKAELAWSEEEEPLVLDFGLKGRVENNRLEAGIVSTDASEHRIDVRLDMPDITSPAQLIAEGSLTGDYASLLVALVPQASQGTGHVGVRARYDGTVQPPVITGQMNIEDATLVVPAAGIELAGIRMSAHADRPELLRFNGTASSGEGTISIDGEVAEPLSAARQVRVSLSGEHFLAANRKDLVLITSPDLVVTQADRRLSVSGGIGIESGEIQLRQFDTGLRARSADVRVKGVEETATPLSRAELDLNLRIDDGVHIVAFGLDTHVAGNLAIQQGRSTPMRALGTLTLTKGTFERYGQKLNIDRGRLIYSGPINNPIVDVVTSRTVTSRNETVRVVLSLSGPANNIQSQITSTPPMSDANALSWLLLGRPLRTASDSEGNELSTAALSFGLKKALPITQEIASTLGLDELSVSDDTKAILAGKQVNPDLYVQYNYDVFSRIGGILLNYSLTPHLSIEAQSGKAKSLELIYSF